MSGERKMTTGEAINEIAYDGMNTLGISAVRSIKKLVTQNSVIKPFVEYTNEVCKRKIEIFIENLDSKNNEDFIEFIDSLTKDEDKIFLAESLRKAISLDDNFQIYIMSCLTKSFILNHTLDYYEKKLYYNINTFSEDDFKIFWGIYKKYDDYKKEVEQSLNAKYDNNDLQDLFKDTEVERVCPPILKIHEMGFVINDIIYSSLNRFVDIGVLTFVSKLQQKDENEYSPSNAYKINSYAKTLFDYLDIYCITNNVNCSDLLEVIKVPSLEDDWV